MFARVHYFYRIYIEREYYLHHYAIGFYAIFFCFLSVVCFSFCFAACFVDLTI